MAAHARLKNEFTEDEKCHNLMTWLKCSLESVTTKQRVYTNNSSYFKELTIVLLFYSNCIRIFLFSILTAVKLAVDCSELTLITQRNGSYTIYPSGTTTKSVTVYCEFNFDGVWTVGMI